MDSYFKEFDRSRLRLEPLGNRTHDLDLSCIKPLEASRRIDPTFETIASRILSARENGAAVILMMGAHVLRAGVQRFIIDMMEKGLLTCIAVNGDSRGLCAE